MFSCGICFLVLQMGVMMHLPIPWTDHSTLHFYTDASEAIDFGIVFSLHYVMDEWPPKWKS